MKTDLETILFMVSGTPERYEDHEAMIHDRLIKLMEAWGNPEDVYHYMESFLDVYVVGEPDFSEVSFQLLDSPPMQSALSELRDRWETFDQSFPPDSVAFGGISQKAANRLFHETNFLLFLETLSSYSK